MFTGHYEEWNKRRLKVIFKHFDSLFFKDKSILEVGCGHAFFSKELMKYGAKATASDARKEYLIGLKGMETICHDLDNPWNLGEYDIIIHFGVLYHLKDPKLALINAIQNSKILILESEVIGSIEDKIIFRNESGFDQAYNNIGNQLSVGAIEKIINDQGKQFNRIDDPELNCALHRYDWALDENTEWKTGRRKFWIIK